MSVSAAHRAVLRRVRRVRRRRHARLVLHAAATLVAVASLTLVVGVLVALRGGRLAFAAATAGALLALAASVWVVVRDLRHAWMALPATGRWIDRRAGLTGRVASVVELPCAGDGLFPLLVAQVLTRRDAWTARRLVPRVLPLAALAAAVTGTLALALVLISAPRLRPRTVIAFGDRPADWVRATDTGADATMLVHEPGVERRDVAPPADADRGPAPAFEAVAALQDWVRDALVGSPEQLGDDLADAGHDTGSPPDGRERTGGRDRRAAGSEPGGPTGQPVPRDGTTAANDADAAARPEPSPERAAATRESTDGGSGAGDGTDPVLYGRPARDGDVVSDRFELAIAARVRTRVGANAAHGLDDDAATATEPDRRPTLASGERAEEPAHRMPVPPSWAPLVRRVFAHAAPEVP